MDEFETVSKAALQAMENGQVVALATVVQVRGSAPRHTGARMLVWPDGQIVGTVGGATMEEKVIEHAREAISERKGRLEKYLLSTDAPNSLGLCGGEVSVHIEVLKPRPTLLLIGAGHVALALAKAADIAGFHISVIDDRAEFLDPERFPAGTHFAHVPYVRETEQLDPMPLHLTPTTAVVVLTWGWDMPALAQILAHPDEPGYVGLLSSRTKWRVIQKMLLERGISQERMDRVFAPSGLNVGAETPGEISISILAEILAVLNKTETEPMKVYVERRVREKQPVKEALQIP